MDVGEPLEREPEPMRLQETPCELRSLVRVAETLTVCVSSMVWDEEGERLTEIGGGPELPQPATAAREKIHESAKLREEP